MWERKPGCLSACSSARRSSHPYRLWFSTCQSHPFPRRPWVSILRGAPHRGLGTNHSLHAPTLWLEPCFPEGHALSPGLPGGSAGKESACHVGDVGLTTGSGRSLEEGNGYPLQYSCLEFHRQRNLAGHSP